MLLARPRRGKQPPRGQNPPAAPPRPAPRRGGLSKMHALGVQPLSADPADACGGVAAGPPAFGPPPQPEMQDAASVTTPSATTQIRLTTADLPAPPHSLTELRSQSPPARGRSRSTTRHSQSRP